MGYMPSNDHARYAAVTDARPKLRWGYDRLAGYPIAVFRERQRLAAGQVDFPLADSGERQVMAADSTGQRNTSAFQTYNAASFGITACALARVSAANSANEIPRNCANVSAIRASSAGSLRPCAMGGDTASRCAVVR